MNSNTSLLFFVYTHKQYMVFWLVIKSECLLWYELRYYFHLVCIRVRVRVRVRIHTIYGHFIALTLLGLWSNGFYTKSYLILLFSLSLSLLSLAFASHITFPTSIIIRSCWTSWTSYERPSQSVSESILQLRINLWSIIYFYHCFSKSWRKCVSSRSIIYMGFARGEDSARKFI